MKVAQLSSTLCDPMTVHGNLSNPRVGGEVDHSGLQGMDGAGGNLTGKW